MPMEMVRSRAASTKTGKGLRIHATINNKSYETKRQIEDIFESNKQTYILFDDNLTKWNYHVMSV